MYYDKDLIDIQDNLRQAICLVDTFNNYLKFEEDYDNSMDYLVTSLELADKCCNDLCDCVLNKRYPRVFFRRTSDISFLDLIVNIDEDARIIVDSIIKCLESLRKYFPTIEEQNNRSFDLNMLGECISEYINQLNDFYNYAEDFLRERKYYR